jgi:tripartite-type tricarboxylate transporter receptor subunit TctC
VKEQTVKRRGAGLIRFVSITLLTLAAGLVTDSSAFAEDFPTRVITIVVPYEAGGGVDRVARLVAEHLQHTWKTSVIVENRAGANGNIGSDYVARADPDGYTILYAPPGPLVINKLLYPKLNYDYDAFVPISLLVMSPNALVVHPKVEAKTVPELIAYAKANPDRLNYGSSGAGGTPHLTAELLKMETGTSFVHIPYRGTSSLITNLLGGNIDIAFSEISNVLEHIRADKLRVLGLAGEKRSPTLPDVPTLAETLPGFYSSTWTGLVAPPRTPPAIVQKFYNALADSFVNTDAVQQMVKASQFEAVVSTPEGLTQHIAAERERWGKVIRATGLRGQ